MWLSHYVPYWIDTLQSNIILSERIWYSNTYCTERWLRRYVSLYQGNLFKAWSCEIIFFVLRKLSSWYATVLTMWITVLGKYCKVQFSLICRFPLRLHGQRQTLEKQISLSSPYAFTTLKPVTALSLSLVGYV